MTQTTQLDVGTAVSHREDDDLVHGEIMESDAWWNTIRLRGVAAEDQVLVSWDHGRGDDGAPFARWERVVDLVVSK